MITFLAAKREREREKERKMKVEDLIPFRAPQSSLSLSHGVPASLLYIYITMQADTYKHHLIVLFSRFSRLSF